MEFVYKSNHKLPPLAWLAQLQEGKDTVTVMCGNAVECTDTFFVAGVWDGDFSKGDFDVTSFACCTGDIGASIVFMAHEEMYEDSLLFMGTRGDSLWERNHANVNNDLDFSSGNTLQRSDCSFTENLLKNNTVLVNVPMIGADHWTEINALSASEEMKPFSVSDSYDRPIPRRIMEERGVERGLFGQKKVGAGISYHFDTLGRLKHKMSPTSFKALLAYKRGLKRNVCACLVNSITFYACEFPVYLNYLFSKIHLPVRFNHKRGGMKSSPIASLLILWGMDVMVKRYKQQL